MGLGWALSKRLEGPGSVGMPHDLLLGARDPGHTPAHQCLLHPQLSWTNDQAARIQNEICEAKLQNGEGGVEWRPSELKEPTNKQTYPRRSGVIIRVLQKQRGEQLEVKVSTVKDNVTKHKTLNPGTEAKPMNTYHLRSWSDIDTKVMGLALKVLTLDLEHSARVQSETNL